MHGFSKLLVVLGLICAVNSASVQETCKAVANGTYIADPTACNKWIYCLNGEPVSGACPGDFLFNVNTASCDYSKNVICRDQLSNSICSGLDKVYIADPSSCNQYIYCVNGNATHGNCPKSQIYNPDTVSCVHPTQKFDCSSSNICELVKDNTFFNDDSSCEGFIRCVNGKAYKGQCKPNYYYNPKNGLCDYPKNVDCKNPSDKPNNQPNFDSSICQGKNQTYVSDGLTCRGSVECKDDKVVKWTQCPSGTHFGGDWQQCVNTDRVACEHDRCDGLPDQYFVAVLGTECKSYTWCMGGKSKSENTCATAYPGYEYFDEVHQICVKTTKPDYIICKAPQ